MGIGFAEHLLEGRVKVRADGRRVATHFDCAVFLDRALHQHLVEGHPFSNRRGGFSGFLLPHRVPAPAAVRVESGLGVEHRDAEGAFGWVLQNVSSKLDAGFEGDEATSLSV